MARALSWMTYAILPLSIRSPPRCRRSKRLPKPPWLRPKSLVAVPRHVIAQLEVLTGEHPFRERLWAQLITAYYVAERQSDALEAYRRLRTNLAENLGIDRGPTIKSTARADPAPRTVGHCARRPGPPPSTAPWRISARTPSPRPGSSAGAELRGTDGQRYPLESSSRIGRQPGQRHRSRR